MSPCMNKTTTKSLGRFVALIMKMTVVVSEVQAIKIFAENTMEIKMTSYLT